MASGPENPVPTTASRCTVQTARGRHLFEIAGFTLLKSDEHIRSAAFTVGGYDWCVRFHPNTHDDDDDHQNYVSIYLELMTKGAEVFVSFDLTLVDGGGTGVMWRFRRQVFNAESQVGGRHRFAKRSEVAASPYLKDDDRLVVECNLTVILGTELTDSRTISHVRVPTSDLSDDLGRLLEHGEGADVTFKVKDEVFRVHKIVLATRSPFFMAKLYGAMRGGSDTRCIAVEDMEPAVFKALLHFIYTDSLPPTLEDDYDRDEYKEVVKHLVVAADMYAMERMKLVCEEILCKTLDVAGVATTLALADQHNCETLRDACIGFIHSSSSRTEAVMATQGYKDIKRSSNSVFVDMWERSVKQRKGL